MTVPLIGAAMLLHNMDILRDWLFDKDRPLEIQDFIPPGIIAGDTSALLRQWQVALQGHHGPRGIHGPFFGLDITNPDTEIRTIIQARMYKALDIASALHAEWMVLHSPFTFWHSLNYTNYPLLRKTLFQAAADCLGPVLERAADAGVTLVLENIDDTSPADRSDLIAKINHPNLKLSVDTGHADLAHAKYGAPPVIDFLQHAGTNLAHVHLQDIDGHADRHWHPGHGRINWKPLMTALAKHPAQPPLLLEVRNNHNRIPKTAAILENLLTGN
ncbi:sugar phosphate isomerase/epimerase [Roseinatronobacter sp. HJB301]|uniref:Sugar phosphate isomerase/epimerase n=1 Tax=Roseinatronobacter alkalisoli TaxID=3028235 RepID=A0ABT5T9J2_9RHOB|nr:sugar phosphate isomerase/epimerase [Roseinatronobacter sp. HJB301]